MFTKEPSEEYLNERKELKDLKKLRTDHLYADSISNLKLRKIIDHNDEGVRKELIEKLEKAAKLAGKNKPLTVGADFYMMMRWVMLKQIKPSTQVKVLKKGIIAQWRNRDIYITKGSLGDIENLKINTELNDPKPK